MKFESLGLNKALLEAIELTGYTDPTDVQARAIPEVLAGSDVLVSSQTGSGKTAAFMLPALQILSTPHPVEGRGPRVLVLTPTRELAMQVTKAAETYGVKLRRIKTVSIVGGMPYPVQNRLLKAGVDILVATPGRLLDQMQSGRVDLSRLQVLVFDEADRMLDMGFKDDIDAVVAQLPAQRQTLLFSATLDNSITALAGDMMKNPVRIDVSGHKTRHVNIEQRLLFADDMSHKNRLLDHLLRDTEVEQAIVFTSTKRAADDLALDLIGQGHAAAALHGDMKQGARTRTLENLKRGRLRVLVATDVAARGIDVQGISHVINFDLPRQAEDYVHRIGRTGRAGRSGVAISLANVREGFQVKLIERFTTQPIPVITIDGMEPKQKVYDSGGRGGPRGNRPHGGNGGSRPQAGKSFGPPRGAGTSFGGGYRGNNDSARPSRDSRDGGFAKASERSYAGVVKPEFAHRTERSDKPAFARSEKPAYTRSEKPAYAARGDKPAYERSEKPAFARSEKPAFERSEKPAFGGKPSYAGKSTFGEKRTDKPSFGKSDGKPASKFESKFESKFDRDAAGKVTPKHGGKVNTRFVGKSLPASTSGKAGGKDSGGWKKASSFAGT
jgi:superfamily II DNA/RNA helicase